MQKPAAAREAARRPDGRALRRAQPEGKIIVNHLATNFRRLTLLGGAGAIAAAGLLGVSAPAQADSVWDRVAECESGGDWSINSGNGYYGGLQFSQQTWEAFGGEGMPHEASKSEQIRVAQNTLETQGPGAWPACGAEAGLTKENGAAADSGDSGSEADESEGSESEGSESDDPALGGNENSSDSESSGETVTVEAGDTLYSIASEHGVSWQDLHEANKDKVSDPTTMSIGLELNLPK